MLYKIRFRVVSFFGFYKKKNMLMNNNIQASQNAHDLTIKISGKFVFNMYKDFSVPYLGKKRQYQKFILDMRGTQYMDTSVLGMLLQTKEHLDTTNKTIHIINCNSHIKNMFEVGKFDLLFTVENMH